MPLSVTLDTNTFPLAQALQALGDIPADIAVTTVTTRELVGSDYHSESVRLRQLPELWVMAESPLGTGAFGTQADADCFEKTLKVISNGSFPPPGQRTSLTDGQQRQKRDAMIFCTHLREGRDIFVTDDVTAFGTEGSTQRQRVTALGRTRIMTLSEFEAFCRVAHSGGGG